MIVASKLTLERHGEQAMANYRVSKAESLRLRAFDKRVEPAEAKKAKAEAKKAKADKKAGAG
jgi:hypothetical protein